MLTIFILKIGSPYVAATSIIQQRGLVKFLNLLQERQRHMLGLLVHFWAEQKLVESQCLGNRIARSRVSLFAICKFRYSQNTEMSWEQWHTKKDLEKVEL
jgi:hypothetical protein